ncbi:MAG: RusA family crossover junction endodeoxyribonuclease [Chlorobiaceae bacterium]|nr:RusA family crossover junction endodeoxyribonuclease [Chlorobiaceae bacterium]
MSVVFFVAGIPVPKGSARAFLHNKTGKVITRQDNADKQKPWASSIAYTAQQNGVRIVNDGPVSIKMEFVMPRLKGHFGTGKNAGVLRDVVPLYHTSKPDLDKLQRCVLDALTGIAWKDDSQVSRIVGALKVYGEQPGVLIEIKQLINNQTEN